MKVTLGNFELTPLCKKWDVCIEYGNNVYFYRIRCSCGCNNISEIIPIEIRRTEETEWSELDVNVRKGLFRAINPNGTEEDMNIFVYGQEVGAKINADNGWAESHLVYSKDITLELIEKLGNFNKVEFLRSVSSSISMDYIYLIDEKWQVAVSVYSESVIKNSCKIEDYGKIVAQRKAFKRRVSRLSKKAGVPWNIGVFVGKITDDEEAISILNRVKAVRGTANKNIRYELRCGIKHRTAAIEGIIGEKWHKMDCKGEKQTTILANYLLGE